LVLNETTHGRKSRETEEFADRFCRFGASFTADRRAWGLRQAKHHKMNDAVRHHAEALRAFETDARPAEGFMGQVGRFIRSFQVSEKVWGRAGLLFAALSLIKAVMLFGFRKHLFETHWRVSSERYDWMNEVAFYVFAVLVGLVVWRIKDLCAGAGTRVIRLANVSVLGLGALLIFFTFHEGQWNYLDPVLNGVLSWKDLGPYLSLNFFFRPPYLSVWIFIYAAVYYGLVRTGREHLILNVTAVAAVVYVVLHLGDLRAYRQALVVVDGVGIACVLASLKVRRPLGLFWFGVPLVWISFWFSMFRRLDTRLDFLRFNPEFAILFWGALIILAGITVLAWRRGFIAGWSWVLPFALATLLLLTNINYNLASSYNNMLCLAFTLPRYFLGEFTLAICVLILGAAYQRLRPGGSLWWLDVVNLALIAVALVDLGLSRVMGVRLDWQLLSLAMGETPKMMWRMARPYLPAVGAALLAIAAVYGVLLRGLRWGFQSGRLSVSPPSSSGARFFLLLFLAMGLAGQHLVGHDKANGQATLLLAGTSPLWQRATSKVMNAETFTKTASTLGMSNMISPRRVAPSTAPKEWNVVMVFQESTYNKYLSLFNGKVETQPLLSKYKNRMEVFPNFFSNFAGSINARFATFTGLYPVADYKAFTLERIPVPSIFEVLHEHGYSNSMFYSSSFDYTGFRDFLRGRGVDEMYDADTMPGERKTPRVSWGLREEETLGAMQERIKKYAAEKQKFFLTYVPAAPHYPFDGTPPRFAKFKMEDVNDFTPLYLNELLYMDWIISSLVDQLSESGLLDNTLVVITDDHGEMLGDQGGQLGHGWAVTPELANVPLIILNPAEPGYRVNRRVGSQVDLLPTMLDLLGIQAPSNQLYQGDSLYSSDGAANRAMYLSSFRQYGVLTHQKLICGDRGSGDAKNSTKVYSITNDVARTRFAETCDTNGLVPSISSFDEFQASFLRNYSHYCDLLKASPESSR
jgi:phosphoglycerol transferase MdoB-like AlkP superfamily enzyme